MRFTGPFTFDTATDREWLLTNGLGGYASATLCGMSTRRYHGLLVAALNPPGDRTLLVAKLEETVTVNGRTIELATNQYPGAIHPQGYTFLREVDVAHDAVTMRFANGKTALDKRVAMCHGVNVTTVCYTNTGSTTLTLALTALVNARNFHGETAENTIPFTVEASAQPGSTRVHVIPAWMREGYWMCADAGEWREDPTWYRNMYYAWEAARGLTPYDNHFSPGRFVVKLKPGESVTVTLSTDAPEALPDATPLIPPPAAPGDPPEIAHLRHAALSFLVRRAAVGGQPATGGQTVIAGYHWFGDWGRDTMIALPGLCFTTGRARDAADILRTFAAALCRGLLPNLFLDSGVGAAYNTVDASLWFIYAVERYYQATRDRDLVAELRPALEQVIGYYRGGTDYGIGMDRDGLIVASAPGWQLTWMDAKVGHWVVTPRMGKPVEINALWYNALCAMDAFAAELGWSGEYRSLSERVREGFGAFWYGEGAYLYDVLGETPDASLRPNQIFAVSLPYTPLEPGRAKAVVSAVERALLTPYGLRTLAPGDPAYRGQYGGGVYDRDGAYHQGTVWAWLIGPYVDAYLRVHGHTAQAKVTCRAALQPLLDHVWQAGIGSISEIFAGDPPHAPHGTISQAWSVSEVLRAWEACQ